MYSNWGIHDGNRPNKQTAEEAFKELPHQCLTHGMLAG